MIKYLNLNIPKKGIVVSVSLNDIGVIVDILDLNGDVIDFTQKTYEEFGKTVITNDPA